MVEKEKIKNEEKENKNWKKKMMSRNRRGEERNENNLLTCLRFVFLYTEEERELLFKRS